MRRLAVVAWAGLVLAAMMLTATLTAQVASAHATRVSAERMRKEFLPPLLQAAATVDKHTRNKG